MTDGEIDTTMLFGRAGIDSPIQSFPAAFAAVVAQN